MLTYQDCLHFSELDNEVILSVADAEHVSMIAACGRARSLADTTRGCRILLKYLLERLESVEKAGNARETVAMHRELHRFTQSHHYI